MLFGFRTRTLIFNGAGEAGWQECYSSDQVALRDRLNDPIKSGGTIATFPSPQDDVLQDNETLTYRTEEKPAPRTRDIPPPNSNLGRIVDAIANRVAELLNLHQPEPPQLPPAAPAVDAVDPLEKYRRLQEVVDAGFLLSSSDLAVLLDRKSLPAKDFDRYGFRFSKAGRNGGETAWRVGKSSD